MIERISELAGELWDRLRSEAVRIWSSLWIRILPKVERWRLLRVAKQQGLTVEQDALGWRMSGTLKGLPVQAILPNAGADERSNADRRLWITVGLGEDPPVHGDFESTSTSA